MARKTPPIIHNDEVVKAKWPLNFETVEDIVICRCWRIITNDPKTGTDQTSDAFWERHFEKFTKIMIEEHGKKREVIRQQRNFKTLQSWWKRCIQKECMLFDSIFWRVKSIEKSGWQEEDYVNEALNE